MDQRSNYLIQILDKIGAPLMGALTVVNASQEDQGDDLSQTAQNMALLLSRTVQTSIDIGKSMDLGIDAEQADAIRVALAGLASPLIAEQYIQSGKIPDDNELKQIVTSLEAVLTFSDNFTPSAENVARLKELKAEGTTVDGPQSIVQFIQALTPAVNAIAAFPFGQQETRLVQDVADRITNKAAELRENIWGAELPEDQEKPIELALVRSLASIYAACHKVETEKLADGDGGTPSLDPVWKSFETQAAMLETIANSILPDDGKTGTTTQKAPPSPPPAKTIDPDTVVDTPPAPPAEEPKSEAPAQNNPMAGFAKPEDKHKPEEEKSSEPQPEKPKDENKDSGSANPMSFFKPPSDPED